MTAELRKLFESELQSYLRECFSSSKFIKVNRNEIKINVAGAIDRIGFRFLTNAQ
jgi:hypothetical protein